jgi:RHS repeat-associated protein
MGTSSAKPAKLQAFVDAAATIRGELVTRIEALTASYFDYQSSGYPYIGNYDLMNVELPAFVQHYADDETFVALVRLAFVNADRVLGADGMAVVDDATFASTFDAVARAAGYDPVAVTSARSIVTVDSPLAAGTPRTSGFVNDPVCTATGHFLEAEDDFTWPDRLALLRWCRTYSSRFVAGGPFGRGWASWASTALVPDEGGDVAYQGPDGQLAVFVPDGDEPGAYQRLSGLQARLVRVENGWELRWDRHSERPGAVWSFDADGLVRSVLDPATGTTTFAYTGGVLTAVEHEGGRRLELDWDGPRIVAVRSSCGRVARYHYDDAGDLVGSERVLGARRYEVDDQGRIVEVWDADGIRLCRNSYDDEGRVLRQVSPFGRETVFRYFPGNRTVVSDTEDGPVNIFEHDQVGRLIGLVDPQGRQLRRSFDAEGRCLEASGFDGAVRRQEFAADGRSATRTTAGGSEERWEYDADGRVVSHEVDGGRRLTFDYDGDGPLPSRLAGPDGWQLGIEVEGGLVRSLTDADGVTVRFEHDADGNVVATANALGAVSRTEPHVSGLASRLVRPDGATYEFERDGAGRMLALRTPLGHEYTVQWTPAGRLAGMVDPDGGHTSFEHGRHGGMERVVDALGATLELSHDHLERLVGFAAPGGAKWELGYSAVGLLSLVHDPAGGAWGYDYDAEGRLVASTDPLGHETRRRYDRAGRLAELVDPTGNAIRYTRDALGRVVREDRPGDAVTTFEWDAWGRALAVRFPDGDSLTYGYTPAGRVRSVTSGEGRGWTDEYDEAGRLVAVTDATGATTRFAWDECDRPVATTWPGGRVDRIAYDAEGRAIETSQGGRTWRAGYDHAGRVTSVTDPAGATRRYRYDLTGKLVSATDRLGHSVRLRYDERGNQVGILDERGGLVTTTYDGMRRPVATTDQLGRVTRVRRDAAGRVTARELPTGEVVEWERDARGLATDVRVGGRDAIVFERDASGRPLLVHEPARNRTFSLGWTRGGRLASLDVDGEAMRWDRDGDGLVVARHDPAGRTTSFAWDRAGRLATVSSDRWGRIALDRDLDGRLVALRAEGVTRTWDHDADGLVAAYHEQGPAGSATTTLVRDATGRVTEARSAAGTSRYAYDAAGQLVAATTPAGAWTWAYDELGRLVAEAGPDGTTAYDYDEAHQLVRMVGPGGTTGFSYDAAGRRIAQSGPAATRRYTWDGLGRLSSVSDSDGPGVQDVDVDAFGRLAAFGTTRLTWDPTAPVAELIAVDGREVISAEGHALAVGGDEPDWLSADWRGSVGPTDPWGRGSAAAADLGPGAFGELALGGLTWLRNRVYDPATRAFLAPDPLPGIPGTPVAANPYHYANNDPVGYVDPLGLQPLSIEQYNDIRAQETGVQWGNIAMGALMVGSFFIPGGPIIATLVGAGLGMAPGIIHGIETGEWDVGGIIKGGIVGGIAGRVGFSFGAFGGGASTLFGGAARGMGGGFVSGLAGEGYDFLPLPGADGHFDMEDVAWNTAIGGVTGPMGVRGRGGHPEDIPVVTPHPGTNEPLALPAGPTPATPATPRNVFPHTADEFTAQLGVEPSYRGTTPDGTPRTRWEPNELTRITMESHPEGLSPGDPGFNPRHHGEHYHVYVRPTPTTGWHNPAVQKLTPPGYTPGSGKSFLPGEPFP